MLAKKAGIIKRIKQPFRIADKTEDALGSVSDMSGDISNMSNRAVGTLDDIRETSKGLRDGQERVRKQKNLILGGVGLGLAGLGAAAYAGHREKMKQRQALEEISESLNNRESEAKTEGPRMGGVGHNMRRRYYQ